LNFLSQRRKNLAAALGKRGSTQWEFPGGVTKLNGPWRSYIVLVMRERLELNLPKFPKLSSEENIRQVINVLAELIICRASFTLCDDLIKRTLKVWFSHDLKPYAPTYKKHLPSLVELIVACSEQRLSLFSCSAASAVYA
jgi:hypothetical protein